MRPSAGCRQPTIPQARSKAPWSPCMVWTASSLPTEPILSSKRALRRRNCRVWRLEQAQDSLRRRCLDGPRGHLAGPAEGCRQDSRLFCASKVGAPWHRDGTARRLRAGCASGGLQAVRDGGYAQRSASLPGARLHCTGEYGSCARERGVPSDRANGEEAVLGPPFVPSDSTTGPFPHSTRRFTLSLSSTRGRAVQRASQDSNQSLGRFVLQFFYLAEVRSVLGMWIGPRKGRPLQGFSPLIRAGPY
jgi:hypothetical protein